MPQEIETVIQRIIQEFLWDSEAKPRIAPGTLELPLDKGGLNLLNVKTRNEAIEIMWLKAYLNFSPTRPTWASVAGGSSRTFLHDELLYKILLRLLRVG